ncbi:MAG: arsenosugar biosynthesis radical SAM protein ArsS [Deltaproteobacteria bacterium]|nr:arsenosugar biosynthesis radical SAM protein ArsS [Deltaproteobacteria bacterium]
MYKADLGQQEPEYSELFASSLKQNGIVVKRKPLKTLQVNMGLLCNQSCHHCHLESGPNRTEIMEKNTVDRILDLLDASPEIQAVDITGGAPEMNPEFRYFVSSLKDLKLEITNRCNLSILQQPGQEGTAFFFKDNQVRLVCSLPCYTAENVNKQRGSNVFEKSVKSLKELNELGYGADGSGLTLDLAYNPLGANLPPDQLLLENDYKIELSKLGIRFNRLLTITNMPIHRFATQLRKQDDLTAYQDLLVTSFNQTNLQNLMCRDLLSVSWDGGIYDCDFNLSLQISVPWKEKSIWEIRAFKNHGEKIAFGDHCFGCTAGAGSSCGGSLERN